MKTKDLDNHITGNHGEDFFANERNAKMVSYREYMGPSGNGMSDRHLKKLAGWTSFEAGWDAAVSFLEAT